MQAITTLQILVCSGAGMISTPYRVHAVARVLLRSLC